MRHLSTLSAAPKIGASGGTDAENAAVDAQRLAEFDKVWVLDVTGHYVRRPGVSSDTITTTTTSEGVTQQIEESNVGKYLLAVGALIVIGGGAYWWTTKKGGKK